MLLIKIHLHKFLQARDQPKKKPKTSDALRTVYLYAFIHSCCVTTSCWSVLQRLWSLSWEHEVYEAPVHHYTHTFTLDAI